MPLTSAQPAALKTDINANQTQIVVGGVTIAIKDLPNNPDVNIEIKNWYNSVTTPTYWVWASSVIRKLVYITKTAEGTTWSWQGFKAQPVVEQTCWIEMFMDRTCDFGALNNRQGVLDIFGTQALGGANRVHIFNVARRPALWIEKLFASEVVSPPSNTGNDGITGNRGKTSNPDTLTWEGQITGDDVTEARKPTT